MSIVSRSSPLIDTHTPYTKRPSTAESTVGQPLNPRKSVN